MPYSLIRSSERAPPFRRHLKMQRNILILSPIQAPSPRDNFQPAFLLKTGYRRKLPQDRTWQRSKTSC